MKPWPLLALALALVLPVAVARAEVEVPGYSRLGQPVWPAGQERGDLLAQRTIDREWGVSEDSTYHEVEVPGWKSEGWAMALSAIAPGAGHLYLGEGSGWAYALAEGALWAGHWYEVRHARDDWNRMVRFMGNPDDSSATFSFERYQAVTHHDPAEIEQLWRGDPGAFYRELNGNPEYLGGFVTAGAQELQRQLNDYLDAHDEAARRQWLFDAALYANHLLAALDALRAARGHNAPLREQYHLELGQRWRNGGREVRAALVRRF